MIISSIVGDQRLSSHLDPQIHTNPVQCTTKLGSILARYLGDLRIRYLRIYGSTDLRIYGHPGTCIDQWHVFCVCFPGGFALWELPPATTCAFGYCLGGWQCHEPPPPGQAYPSARLSFCCTPSTFRRCFNRDGERASAKRQSRQWLGKPPGRARGRVGRQCTRVNDVAAHAIR